MPQREPSRRNRRAKRAGDLIVLGALFILTGLVDLGVIAANPDYRLAVFGMRPDGLIGWAAKLQSPAMHALLGVGFIQQRRWALVLFMIYTGYGIANATVNFIMLGFGWIRLIFLLGSFAFLAYVWRRRAAFEARPAVHLTLVKEEHA